MSYIKSISDIKDQATDLFSGVENLKELKDSSVDQIKSYLDFKKIANEVSADASRLGISRINPFPITRRGNHALINSNKLTSAINNQFGYHPPQFDESVGNAFERLFTLSTDIDPHLKAYPVMFMTKPDIPVFEKYEVGKFFQDKDTFNKVRDDEFSFINSASIESLVQGNWIVPFSQNFRSITMPDINISIEPSIINLQKEKNMLPTFIAGENGGTFTTKLIEREDLVNTRILYTWMKYIKLVSEGTISPKLETIKNDIIDYKVSCFVFFTKPNLQDISFVGKYTGVMPLKTPFGAMSADVETIEITKLDVEWSYDYFEFGGYQMIQDFKKLSSGIGVDVVQNEDSGAYKFAFV